MMINVNILCTYQHSNTKNNHTERQTQTISRTFRYTRRAGGSRTLDRVLGWVWVGVSVCVSVCMRVCACLSVCGDLGRGRRR